MALEKLAVTAEQKVALGKEMIRFEQGLFDRYNKLLDATLRT